MYWLCRIIGHKHGIKTKMISHTVNGREIVRPADGAYAHLYCRRKKCNWEEIE